jgi:hypothetical protein
VICLTGDIHHQSLRTGNQLASDQSEAALAVQAMDMALEENIRLTYFLTGRLVSEDPRTCARFAEESALEIGGHNYWCFEPQLLHRVWKKLTGDYGGPRLWQKHDTEKTIRVINQQLGRSVRSWRNHMYMHGPQIDEILRDAGVEICSDGVERGCAGPRMHTSGMWHMPINVIPDHEHLYHAERTPQWVAQWVRRYNWSDDFGSDSYFVDDWAERVIRGVEENEARGVHSMVIIHPITMYLCDAFKAYRRILSALARYQCVTVSEMLDVTTNSKSEERYCA